MRNSSALANTPISRAIGDGNKQRIAQSMRYYFNEKIIENKSDEEVIELFCSQEFQLESSSEIESPRTSHVPSPKYFTFNNPTLEKEISPSEELFFPLGKLKPSSKPEKKLFPLDTSVHNRKVASLPSTPSVSSLTAITPPHNLGKKLTVSWKSPLNLRKSSQKQNPKPFTFNFYHTLGRRWYAAICENHIEIIQYFIEHKIFDINFAFKVKLNFLPDPNSPATALSVAVAKNRIELTKLLLDSGAQLDVDNVANNHPLHVAAFYGNEKNMKTIMRLLLENANSNPNFTNINGDTALMIAIQNSQYNIIPLLVEKGTNINLQNHKGETAFQIGSRTIDSAHSHILSLLDPTLKKENKTPIVPFKSLDEPNSTPNFHFFSLICSLFHFIFRILCQPFILLKKCFVPELPQRKQYAITMEDLSSKLFQMMNPRPYVYFAIKTNQFDEIEAYIEKDIEYIAQYNHCNSKLIVKYMMEAYDNLIFLLRKNVSNQLNLDHIDLT